MSWPPSDEFVRLQAAARDGDLGTARALLDGGVDPSAPFGAPREWSPLMSAAYYGHLPVVELLVTRGADLDAVEVDGWLTALDLARMGGRDEIAAYLEAAGCKTGDRIPNPHRGGRLGGWVRGPDDQ